MKLDGEGFPVNEQRITNELKKNQLKNNGKRFA
jgi:hypothetical protein